MPSSHIHGYTAEQTRAVLAVIAPNGLTTTRQISDACHSLLTLAAQIYLSGAGLDPGSAPAARLAVEMANDADRAMLNTAERCFRSDQSQTRPQSAGHVIH